MMKRTLKTIIKKYSIEFIWHFTDKSNLALIKKHGLLSLSEIERRGIEIPICGGNEWSHGVDKQKGLDKYVHLSFTDDHPMLYVARNREENRIIKPIWLKIAVSIILEDNVKFCCEVSNKSGAEIIDAVRAKDEIDFEALFTYLDWNDPENKRRRQEAVKSEILVPKMIPYNKVKGFKNG